MLLITDINTYFSFQYGPTHAIAAGEKVNHKWNHRNVRNNKSPKGIYSCFFLIHLRSECLEI